MIPKVRYLLFLVQIISIVCIIFLPEQDKWFLWALALATVGVFADLLRPGEAVATPIEKLRSAKESDMLNRISRK